ncbi:tetratricopeptide repeat protein [Phenylobacterium sp.]|jgi:tetratricopeptide (TPR) repeat protein|uniref:tetratricopeptide repeat protein n=1 Tax=Phenylobacterium sp. TaxID=1871053 RepID=UPI002E37BBDF|nr:tetratricopeptide repeat protein [Phenylobacterium sp.]HEX3365023.1 tetratricopeptide repeat protein [Phenylobacterium sp.]
MSVWRPTPVTVPVAQTPLALAAALERSGDLAGAFAGYETALSARPDDPEILAGLAGLAIRMELTEVAERLWAQVSHLDPRRLEAIDGRARALRDLGRFDEAVILLREALLSNPQEARLWNSLGVTLTQDSQAAASIVFFEEAERLDPRFAAAIYNRGNARFDLGDLEGARIDFERAHRAARKPSDLAAIAFAEATLALARGDLAHGWDAYEARASRHRPEALAFDLPGRRWTPGTRLAHRRLLVVGEQGLGDELMFASLLPDVLAALGPQPRLSLAVEPRVVQLFARSFPAAEVVAHATERVGATPYRTTPGLTRPRSIDLWAPMGSLPRQFRRSLADFPNAGGYLQAHAVLTERWRRWLGDGPPAVGISWRSVKAAGDRRRQYPPRELWAPLLRTPGVRIVNVQYGDCAEELAAFRAETGVAILEPPLDIREDIDGLAALLSALPLTVCVANATGALAGAVGAKVAILGAPAAWPRLGTDALPWYPQAKALTAPAFGDWGPAMDAAAGLASALAG